MKISEVMSRNPEVIKTMDELLVRRLPAMSRDKRLVGIVSIEDIRPRKH